MKRGTIKHRVSQLRESLNENRQALAKAMQIQNELQQERTKANQNLASLRKEIKDSDNEFRKMARKTGFGLLAIIGLYVVSAVIFFPVLYEHRGEFQITQFKLFFLVGVLFVFWTLLFISLKANSDLLAWAAIFIFILVTLIASS